MSVFSHFHPYWLKQAEGVYVKTSLESFLTFTGPDGFFSPPKALYRKTSQTSGLQDSQHSWEKGHTKGAHTVLFCLFICTTNCFQGKFDTYFILINLQKLKDVAFPQAEILKKALLKRFEQEYAQYLVKKVSWNTLLWIYTLASRCYIKSHWKGLRD